MKERALSSLQKAASDFINQQSNRQSLITVTRVSLDNRGTKGEVYVSVFPDENTKTAVEFLNRHRDDFRIFLKKHISLRALPRIQFLADPNISGVVEEKPEEAAL